MKSIHTSESTHKKDDTASHNSSSDTGTHTKEGVAHSAKETEETKGEEKKEYVAK